MICLESFLSLRLLCFMLGVIMIVMADASVYSSKILAHSFSMSDNLTEAERENFRKTDLPAIFIIALHEENGKEFTCEEMAVLKKFVVKYNLDNN